jgi:hypothetical protein
MIPTAASDALKYMITALPDYTDCWRS